MKPLGRPKRRRGRCAVARDLWEGTIDADAKCYYSGTCIGVCGDPGLYYEAYESETEVGLYKMNCIWFRWHIA